jgi:hypothetical protein
MKCPPVRGWWLRTIAALLLLAPAGLVEGQGIEPSIGFGWIGLDATHLAVTGSARIYMVRGLSFDPEVLYVRGSNDRGVTTTALQAGPGFAYRLYQGRFSPYVIGGAHFGRVRRTFDCQFPSRCVAPETSFSWNSGSAGGGVRLRAGDSLFVSPELRAIGDKDGLYFRFTINIGVTFGAGTP